MNIIESFTNATEVLENMDEKQHEELLEWIDQIHQNFADAYGHSTAVLSEYSVTANLAALAFAAGYTYAAQFLDEPVIEVPMTPDGIRSYIAFLTESGERDG